MSATPQPTGECLADGSYMLSDCFHDSDFLAARAPDSVRLTPPRVLPGRMAIRPGPHQLKHIAAFLIEAGLFHFTHTDSFENVSENADYVIVTGRSGTLDGDIYRRERYSRRSECDRFEDRVCEALYDILEDHRDLVVDELNHGGERDVRSKGPSRRALERVGQDLREALQDVLEDSLGDVPDELILGRRGDHLREALQDALEARLDDIFDDLTLNGTRDERPERSTRSNRSGRAREDWVKIIQDVLRNRLNASVEDISTSGGRDPLDDWDLMIDTHWGPYSDPEQLTAEFLFVDRITGANAWLPCPYGPLPQPLIRPPPEYYRPDQRPIWRYNSHAMADAMVRGTYLGRIPTRTEGPSNPATPRATTRHTGNPGSEDEVQPRSSDAGISKQNEKALAAEKKTEKSRFQTPAATVGRKFSSGDAKDDFEVSIVESDGVENGATKAREQQSRGKGKSSSLDLNVLGF